MNIKFNYNWPLGDDSVNVSLGMANIEDPNFDFRVGVVKKIKAEKVYWQGETEWLSYEQVGKINFYVKRGDEVVLGKRRKKDKKITTYQWNTLEKWPPEAQGLSTTVMSYDI